MLNEKILESDKKVDTFDAFWDNIVGFYNYEDAKANDSEPLRYLEQYCEDQFNHQFRLKQGVDEYFSDKSADRVLREQAQFVVESIEKHLYTQWYEGKYSMADLMGICEQVLLYLKQKIDRNEEEVSKIEEDINTFTDDKVANNDVFDSSRGKQSNIDRRRHSVCSVLSRLICHSASLNQVAILDSISGVQIHNGIALPNATSNHADVGQLIASTIDEGNQGADAFLGLFDFSHRN